MKKILIFFMFLFSLTSLAERYFIISKDGYANLREEAAIKSKVIKKVDNSYIIFNPYPNDKNGYKDWYFVEIEKPSYEESASGYIHKSQLNIHPETYVTSSKDNYINVRSEPTTSSGVIDELPNGSYVTRHPNKTVGDWYYVDYDGKIYHVDEDGEEVSIEIYKGYIHKSQLKKFKK